MKVQFERTVEGVTRCTVDHYELAVPGYKCTDNGPEIIDNIKVKEEE